MAIKIEKPRRTTDSAGPPAQFADGTAAAPSITFASDTDTGLYRVGADAVGVAIAGQGVVVFQQGAGVIGLLGNGQIKAGASSLVASGGDYTTQLNLDYPTDGGYQLNPLGGTNNFGQTFSSGMITELLTIAAAATSVTTMSLPLNALILAVSVRVTTVIPTAATFTVTGNTSGTQFDKAGGVLVAAETTDVGTANCPYSNGAAQTVRITPNLSPAANTGRVRVVIWYYQIAAPTS